MAVVNMSEPKIPVALREGFAEALMKFLDWESGEEPRIVFEDRLTGISSVFFAVSRFNEPMIESIHRAALRCVGGSVDAIELIRDRSYGMAARILFRLTELKQAGWQAESLTTCLPLEGGWSTSFPLADDDRPETAADARKGRH